MFDPELDNDDDGGIEKQEDDNEIAPPPKPEKSTLMKAGSKMKNRLPMVEAPKSFEARLCGVIL